MEQKTRVMVLFGGRSAEHEVSLQSAKNVIEALDKEKYDVLVVGITKQGQWLLGDTQNYLIHAKDPKRIALNQRTTTVALAPSHKNGQIIAAPYDTTSIDVVFPVFHGPNCEDGTIQGFLKLLHVPFIGPSVLGAALTMDKDAAKRLLRDAGLPVPKFVVYHRQHRKNITFETIVSQVGLPFFVKPPTLGSSIGVSKVHNKSELLQALDLAFKYDTKVMIEQFIEGREVECGVLGNEHPKASAVGEVIVHHEYYDYEAKYIDEHGASLQIPARLPKRLTRQIQKLAVETFQILCCEGMARVDFFIDKQNRPYVNEVNPIPGFTNNSMYPKLWEISGLSQPELLDQLISLAIQRHKRDEKLRTSYV